MMRTFSCIPQKMVTMRIFARISPQKWWRSEPSRGYPKKMVTMRTFSWISSKNSDMRNFSWIFQKIVTMRTFSWISQIFNLHSLHLYNKFFTKLKYNNNSTCNTVSVSSKLYNRQMGGVGDFRFSEQCCRKLKFLWVVMPCHCAGSSHLFEGPYRLTLQNQLGDLEEQGCTIIRYIRNCIANDMLSHPCKLQVFK